jgi:hypothetical protein
MKQIIYILIILISFSSCTAFKKVIKEKEHISKTSEKSKSVVDSIVSVWNNRGIDDQFTFKIPRSNTADKTKDSILDARLDEILAKINFKKRSGSNSYRMRYNPKKREIETNVIVGATKDSISNVTKSDDKVVKETTSIKSYIKKTGIPMLYIYIGLAFVFRKQIYWLLGIAFPALKANKFLKFFK